MTVFDALPCGWLHIDEQRIIRDANDEAARLLACTRAELVGQRLSAFLPVASRIFFHVQVYAQLLERPQLDEVYVSLQTKTGADLPVLMSLRRASEPQGTHYGVIFQPMRRRHLVERELIHSREEADRAVAAEQVALTQVRDAQARLALQERLAAMGRLAAGVAHEINNPLTFVLGNLHMIEERLDAAGESSTGTPVELRPLVRDMQDGLTRIRGIVTSLRGLSRVDQHGVTPVDIAAVLATAQRLCAHEFKGRAVVTLDVPSPAPVVAGDEGRLVQVFVNLLVNAVQAMPDRPARENHIVIRAHALETGVARIEVEDNGSGIPAGIQARIFEPFFTTKAVGAGTGLGLSVSHGIITGLGGRMDVTSMEGEGTAFRIWLPLATASTPAVTASGPSSPSRLSSPSSPSRIPATPRLLVVDDEEFVAKTITRMLTGYDVTVVTSGEAAVRRFDSGERYDLVLCDLMMPGISGRQVYETALARAPELARRFIFMTGGTFTQADSQFLQHLPNEHVEKPFHPQALRQVCARGLAAAHASGDESTQPIRDAP